MTEYEIRKSKGGNLYHAVPKGDHMALCGYEPSGNNSYLMRDRSGWYRTTVAEPTCRRCKKLWDKPNA